MDLGKMVSEWRMCGVCGREFRSDRPDVVGMRERRSALQKLSDHLIEHQPTPEQWAVAYERIKATTPRRLRGMSGE